MIQEQSSPAVLRSHGAILKPKKQRRGDDQAVSSSVEGGTLKKSIRVASQHEAISLGTGNDLSFNLPAIAGHHKLVDSNNNVRLTEHSLQISPKRNYFQSNLRTE